MTILRKGLSLSLSLSLVILPGRAWGGGTPEDGNDTTDEDSDGSLLTRRIYVSSMGGPVISDFTLGTGAAQSSTSNEDIVTFTTDATGTNAYMDLNYDLPFTKGELTAMLRVKSMGGTPLCRVKAGWTLLADGSTGTTTVNFGSTGTRVVPLPAVPEDSTITSFRVECVSTTAGEELVLDWITIQNGRYKWAPINDVSANPSTTGLPGMGRKGFVRAAWTSLGTPGGRVFAGGDVGGFAWSDDGLVWNMANGDFNEWIYDDQPGVWDAFAIETVDASTQPVWVLGGHKDLNYEGGLYYTAAVDDFNQSWARLDLPSGERLGTSKHEDICHDISSGRGKGVSSGTLMLPEPDLGSGFGNTVLIGSSTEAATDLYVLDTATNAVTLAPYTGLPHQTDTSEPAAAPNVMISALAMDSDSDWLLVGYRLIGYGDEENALYICPADWSVGGACTEVLMDSLPFSFDVRDIVSHPTVGGLFYVADSGRLFLSGACATEVESTVYSVAVDTTGAVTVLDTDGTATTPTWTGGAAYTSPDCWGNTTGTTGNLVPPKADASASEISSLAIDPGGAFLIASFPRDNGDRDYGCVNTFRAAVDESPSTELDWEPLQEWHAGQMNFYSTTATDDNVQRRTVMKTDPGMLASFLGSEPLPEMWAGSYTHDLCFADFAGSNYELVTAGDNIWLYPPDEGGATVGWNSDGSAKDLDQIPILLGFDDGGATFQDPIVNGIGTCRLCTTTPAGGAVDAVLVAGLEDFKMATVYAMSSTGVREPADRPCEVHKLNSSGQAVSVWQPAASTPQAWMSYAPQGDATDAGLARGLIFAADARQANANKGWCWDAVSLTGFTNANFEGDRCNSADPDVCQYQGVTPDGITDLVCQDGGEHSDVWWNTCDETSTGPLNLDSMVLGTIKDLQAYAADNAVLLAASATISGVADGEGLFLATYLGAGLGIQYTTISGGGPPIGFYDFDDQPALAVDLRHYSAGVSLPVYVTSKDSTEGGLWRVDINLATPTSSTWTELDVATNCPSMTASRIFGAAVNTDGTQLLVYGGQDSGLCAVDVSAWPTYTVTEAIPAAYFDILVRDGIAHPHLDDTWFVTGYARSDADDWSGVYIVQRRYRPDTGAWAWSSRRLSPNTQEHRMGMSLDWGPGYGTLAVDHLDRLYAGTSGGGVWELKMLWE